MRIEVTGWQVRDAIRNYLSDNYGLDLMDEDMEDMEHEFSYRKIVFKKHKNGKVMKDKDGHRIIDEEKSSLVYSSASLDEYGSMFTMFIMPTEDRQ